MLGHSTMRKRLKQKESSKSWRDRWNEKNKLCENKCHSQVVISVAKSGMKIEEANTHTKDLIKKGIFNLWEHKESVKIQFHSSSKVSLKIWNKKRTFLIHSCELSGIFDICSFNCLVNIRLESSFWKIIFLTKLKERNSVRRSC